MTFFGVTQNTQSLSSLFLGESGMELTFLFLCNLGMNIHVCRILILSPSHSGPPLSGGNLRGGGEGDLQDLSRVLEPPGCRTVPGKPILHFSFPSPSITAKHSSTKTTLPPSAVQGVCPVNPSVCLSVCLSVYCMHVCVRDVEVCKVTCYTIHEPHPSDLILCKATHCAGQVLPIPGPHQLFYE